MDKKEKIIIITLIIIIILLIGAVCYFVFNNSSNRETAPNNSTNTTNSTDSANVTLNATHVESDEENSVQSSSPYDDPEYGTDSYVDRWDESQKNGDDWAYLHDQPVKTDDDGHRYKRMYDESKGESYWYQMN